MHIRELLDLPSDTSASYSTGFPGLDELISFRPGQVWVITGEPASGKSTLLTQFVRDLAMRHSFHARLCTSPREELATYRSWLLDRAAPRPESPWVEDEVRELASADLHIVSAESGLGLPRDSAGPWCLALDDPERKSEGLLYEDSRAHIRSLAERGGLVLVTAPRRHCLEPRTWAWHGPGPTSYATSRPDRLREPWASIADVVLEIEPTDPTEWTLRMLQNRGGPVDQFRLGRICSRFIQIVDST